MGRREAPGLLTWTGADMSVTPQESRILVASSCLALLAVVGAALRGLHVASLAGTAVFACSVNYWRWPREDWRRTADHLVAMSVMLLHLSFASSSSNGCVWLCIQARAREEHQHLPGLADRRRLRAASHELLRGLRVSHGPIRSVLLAPLPQAVGSGFWFAANEGWARRRWWWVWSHAAFHAVSTAGCLVLYAGMSTAAGA